MKYLLRYFLFWIIVFSHSGVTAQECSTNGMLEFFVDAKEISARVFVVRDSRWEHMIYFAVKELRKTLGYKIIAIDSFANKLNIPCGTKGSDSLNTICILDAYEVSEYCNSVYPELCDDKAGEILGHEVQFRTGSDIVIKEIKLEELGDYFIQFPPPQDFFVKKIGGKLTIDNEKYREWEDMGRILFSMGGDLQLALIKHELLHSVGFGHFRSGIMTEALGENIEFDNPSNPDLDPPPLMSIDEYVKNYSSPPALQIAEEQLTNWKCLMKKKKFSPWPLEPCIVTSTGCE